MKHLGYEIAVQVPQVNHNRLLTEPHFHPNLLIEPITWSLCLLWQFLLDFLNFFLAS